MVTRTVTPDCGQRVDQPPELAARQRIDAAGRLVEKEDRRLVEDRAAEREPLPPAAGEIARERVLAAAQAGHLDHERAPRFEPRAAQPVDAAEEADVLIDGEQLVEREPLRHVADAPLDAFRIGGRRRCRRRCAVPDVGSQQAAEHADRRRLAGAVAAEEAEDLAASRRRTTRRRRRRTRRIGASGASLSMAFERGRLAGTAGHATVPIARSRRASASRALAARAREIELGLQHARARASSTSVLVATPALNRSPTTRRASVALRTPSVPRAIAARLESSSSRRCCTSNATCRSKSAARASSGARCRGRLGLLGAAAAAVPERPADVDRHVPRVLPAAVRGKMRGFGPRVVVAAVDPDLRPGGRRDRGLARA